jgi:hypothetical protein
MFGALGKAPIIKLLRDPRAQEDSFFGLKIWNVEAFA